MAVTSAVGDLVASIYELFASFVGAIVSLVQGLFNMIAGFVGGLVHLVRDVFAGVFRAVGGLGNFVFGNMLVIGVVGVVAYLVLQASKQGKIQAKKN
ncbi:hypothetical protein P8C59_000978 [Phyllachora maydis]|uniref:Uncharacterized protein n=1 Tax=Phyllachora maydis TaxID=1825666 RepID=A0AAD9HXA0_9PEZI|nr:hypothetical protein P8C59_000978 [Phyllachora maydis]